MNLQQYEALKLTQMISLRKSLTEVPLTRFFKLTISPEQLDEIACFFCFFLLIDTN